MSLLVEESTSEFKAAAAQEQEGKNCFLANNNNGDRCQPPLADENQPKAEKKLEKNDNNNNRRGTAQGQQCSDDAHAPKNKTSATLQLPYATTPSSNRYRLNLAEKNNLLVTVKRDDVRPNDVLFGAGGATNSFSGNLFYRKVVKANAMRYHETPFFEEKEYIAKKIYNTIVREGNGRFLIKDSQGDGCLFREAPLAATMPKIMQACRDFIKSEKKKKRTAAVLEKVVTASATSHREAARAGTITTTTTLTTQSTEISNAAGSPPNKTFVASLPAQKKQKLLTTMSPPSIGNNSIVTTNGVPVTAPKSVLTLEDGAVLTKATVSGLLQHPPDDKRIFALTNLSSLYHIQMTGTWDGEYRNLQMLLSALIPQLPKEHPYFKLVKKSLLKATRKRLPSPEEMQIHMEAAWHNGFDHEGRDYYEGKIKGTKTPIGVAEVQGLLTCWFLDTALFQIVNNPAKKKNSGPTATTILPSFVWHYFLTGNSKGWPVSEKTECCCRRALSGKRPGNKLKHASISSSNGLLLILQWPGHSVLLVGMEGPADCDDDTDDDDWSQWNLLVLDPSKNYSDVMKGDAAFWRFPCSALDEEVYQILVVGSDPLALEQHTKRMTEQYVFTVACVD